MRKLLVCILLLCSTFSLSMPAKSPDVISFNFAFGSDEFETVQINGDTSVITSSKYQIFSSYDVTKPELPLIYLKILLPPNTDVSDISFSKTNNLFQNDVILHNCRLPMRIGQLQGTDTAPQQWYEIKEYDSYLKYIQSYSMDNYRIATFEVSPFSYDAVSGRLYLSGFTLDIHLKSMEGNEMRFVSSRRDEANRFTIRNDVFNKDDLDRLYTTNNMKTQIDAGYAPQLQNDKYLIITTDTLKNAFMPLLEWKKEKGLDVEIISTDSIYNRKIPGNKPDIYKIREYIKRKYIEDASADLYVVLGGDKDIIPTAYCKSPFIADTTNMISNMVNQYDEYIPCDPYFAYVSSSILDTCNIVNDTLVNIIPNSIYNISSHIYIGRLPAKNNADVTAMVNKIIKYEKNLPDSCGDRALFCGSKLYYEYSRDSNFNYPLASDVDTVYSKITLSHMANWSGTIDYLFDTYSNKYTDQDNINGTGYLNKDRFAELFRKNYSFVCECTHGEYGLWHMGGPTYQASDFTTSMADTIQSDYPKVLISAACFTNEFDKDETSEGSCIGEALMRNPRSGVVACLGNTREGFSDESASLTDPPKKTKNSHGINNYFIEALYEHSDSLCNDGHLGKLVEYARQKLEDGSSYSKWIKLSLNLFGDPETQVYNNRPQRFTNAFCDAEDGCAYLCSGAKNTVFVEYSVGIDGVYRLSNTGIQENAADTITEMIPDSLEFVIKKQNYIPLRFKVYNDRKYIQNEIINQNTQYDASYRYIDVGSNVTRIKQSGPVIIRSGTLSCTASNTVHIDTGFTCPIDGEIKINVNKNYGDDEQ